MGAYPRGSPVSEDALEQELDLILCSSKGSVKTQRYEAELEENREEKQQLQFLKKKNESQEAETQNQDLHMLHSDDDDDEEENAQNRHLKRRIEYDRDKQQEEEELNQQKLENHFYLSSSDSEDFEKENWEEEQEEEELERKKKGHSQMKPSSVWLQSKEDEILMELEDKEAITGTFEDTTSVKQDNCTGSSKLWQSEQLETESLSLGRSPLEIRDIKRFLYEEEYDVSRTANDLNLLLIN